MIGNAFTQLNIHIPITSLLLFSLGALLLAVWAIFSIIVRYHWKNYGMNKLEVLKMTLIYFIGSGILLLLIGAFAFSYTIPIN